jgi:hypothetical protein
MDLGFTGQLISQLDLQVTLDHTMLMLVINDLDGCSGDTSGYSD